MKKQFLRTGAVITAFSLAAGLPGIRTVEASEENIKTFRYEGIDYFYTLNEEEEIVWTAKLPETEEDEEMEILIPPFVEEDSEPLKEEDLPAGDAETTVKLIVTEITSEALIFAGEPSVPENVPAEEESVPEVISENEIPAAPVIDPTVIPAAEELPAELPEENAETEVESVTAEEENAPQPEESISPEAESAEPQPEETVSSGTESVEPQPEETSKEENAVSEQPVTTEQAVVVTPTAEPKTESQTEPAESQAESEEPAGEETPAASGETESTEPQPAEKAEEPPEAPAAADEAAEEAVPEEVKPVAETAETEPVSEKIEEENPLLLLGKQEQLRKYDNLIAAAANPVPEASEYEEENLAEEELTEETVTAEPAGEAETSETAENDVTETSKLRAVIPEAVETTIEELEQPAEVTSVEETVVNAAPGSQQIIGDTDAPGSKTITAAPTEAPAPVTAAPTATPVPETSQPTAAPDQSSSSNADSGNGKRSNPKTGDPSSPFAYMAAIVASGTAFFTAKRKKRD